MKYETKEGGWFTKGVGEAMGLAFGKKFLKKSCSYSLAIGGRGRVRFWEDVWCSEEPLFAMFLRYIHYLSLKRQK